MILVYVLAVWLLLALGSDLIADAFGTEGDARRIVVFFCLFVAGSFIFNGALFVANAAFNNLGYPLYSTLLNWGRATLSVVPFIWFGARWYGAEGVMAGYGLGVVLFGALGIVWCLRVLADREFRTSDSAGTVPAPSHRRRRRSPRRARWL